MSKRDVGLDGPMVQDQSEALKEANERAERAEAELAKLKTKSGVISSRDGEGHGSPSEEAHAAGDPDSQGAEALRQDSMMSYLLDSLDVGKDIGHYGRLVFAMVARHFLTEDEVIAELTKDPDFSEDQAVGMLRQVEAHDYNPPRRERILEWQAEQEFPILPDANNPDCGNVYKSLRFPKQIYDHITQRAEEVAAGSAAS